MTPRARWARARFDAQPACRVLVVVASLLAVTASAGAHEVRPGAVVFTELRPQIYAVHVHPGSAGSGAPIRPTPETPCTWADGALDCRATGLTDVTLPELDGASLTFGVVVRPLRGDAIRRVLGPGESHMRLADPPRSWTSWLTTGAAHVAFGWDHLLFVVLLGWLLFRADGSSRWARALGAVTGFTLGHSVTLGAVALGALRVPSEAVELSIALSIAWLAREVVLERPVVGMLATFCFVTGLIHGCGFGGALLGIGLPPADAARALVGFNLGVELAQLAVLTATWALARLVHGTARQVRIVGNVLGWVGGAVACAWCSVRLIAYAGALAAG